MSKFAASLDALFSAEAEALNSNSADLLINQFQTSERQEETKHQTANNGRNTGSSQASAAPVDPIIPGVLQEHSEGCEESSPSEDGSAN
jgi:hypothetical protein